MGPNAANVNEQRTDIVAKRKKKEENKRIAGKTTSKRSKAFRRGNLSYHGSSCEKMKLVLALILVAASMVTCEEATSKDEGKDKFATKKEVEEQKADLAKLRQELQEQFQKELKDEIAKVKVGNSNLRRADSDVLKAEVELRRAEKEEEAENAELRQQIEQERNSKRQADVLIETKKLIRAEIETYLNTHSVCQIGSVNFPPELKRRSGSKTITFNRKFSKRPQAQVALSFVQWTKIKAGASISASAGVGEVTTTSMKISVSSNNSLNDQGYVYATWIACI